MRYTNEEILARLAERCKEADIEFLGFNNAENTYKNDRTRLILKCNKCGHVWDTLQYGKFVRVKRGCKNCCSSKKKSESEIIEEIKSICKERDYTFIGFNEGFNGINTKLSLKCNKCGAAWNTTSYNNLRKNDRKSHTCNKSNPSFMPHLYDTNKIIRKIEESLDGTSLKFVSFDEDGYVGREKTHVILKCKKCGKEDKYTFRCLNQKLLCKHCEIGGRFSNEKAISLINEKCNKLGFTFLGFLSNDGKYNGKHTYLSLRCNKCGKTWNTTTFTYFVNNSTRCMNCSSHSKMEDEIETALKENGITFISQCRSDILPWLKYKNSLSLDFYLPQYNVAIECQGIQHFEPIDYFGGKEAFNECLRRDKKKLEICKKHKTDLLYFDSKNGHEKFLNEIVYNDKNKLIQTILNHERKEN